MSQSRRPGNLGAYLAWHLEHEGQGQAKARRFWLWMVLFMASMVGVACARDLVLLFVFFDLTAVARERAAALIFTDNRGRNALSSALLGSVSAGVVGSRIARSGLVPASVRDA